MACARELHWLAICLVIVVVQLACGEMLVPCYFIFGDSLVDAGNNNHLPTAAKVHYPPYGMDFPYGPTGRFTNGRTIADFFGELLGFPNFIKSFPSARGFEIIRGVNYGSGSAGIRDESGEEMGENIPFNKQLENHQITTSRIASITGDNQSTIEYLNKCLYLSVIGHNDYLHNYFMPQHCNSSSLYSPEQFAKILLERFTGQLKILHSLGARKVALAGLGMIGCTPNATSHYGTNGSLCVNKMNNAVIPFNKGLKSLVNELNRDLADAKFVFLNLYTLIPDFTTYQGNVLNIEGCCPVNDYGLCRPSKPPCPNRDSALFWDSYHPTEFLNRIITTPLCNDLRQII